MSSVATSATKAVTPTMMEPKAKLPDFDLLNGADDVTATPEDKRKLSPDVSPKLQQTNDGKKLKETKMQPEILCQCLQKCSERVSQQSKDKLFNIFRELDDEESQNEFLQKFINSRPVMARMFCKQTTECNEESLRRIYCKYRIPMIPPEDIRLNINCDPNKDENSDFDEMYSVATMNSNQDIDSYVNVCLKAFINLFGISETRLRYVRESLLHKCRQKYIKTVDEIKGNQVDVLLANYLTQSWPLLVHINKEDFNKLMTAIINDINLVSNFFNNQLWKPEYFNENHLNNLNQF